MLTNNTPTETRPNSTVQLSNTTIRQGKTTIY